MGKIMNKKNENKADKKAERKVRADFGKMGKFRFILCVVIAFVAVVLKAAFVVPIANTTVEGTTCEAYSTHISMVDYLTKNRTKSCENYEVKLGMYMLENVMVFAVVAGAGFALANIIPHKNTKKK